MNRADWIDWLHQKIVVFDGAMGTQIQSLSLTANDFGGEAFEGCNENLVLTRPDLIETIHRNYLSAGADVVETNTFGATPLVLAEYQLSHQARAINKAAAQIAKRATADFSKPGKPRLVAGSMGPTTKSISVTGGVTFDELIGHYGEQALGLLEGGADLLLLETGQDTLNIKAGLIGIWQALKQLGLKQSDVPVLVSGTIEPMGSMLAGQTADALYASLEHAQLAGIGLNCATGPEAMQDHIRSLAERASMPVGCLPNAGLPDEEGRYHETPSTLAQKLSLFMDKGYINFVGGCCGTTPAHIKELAQAASQFKPRTNTPAQRLTLSGIDFIDIEDVKPVIVGERTNVIGSRHFKDLIVHGQFEEAAEIGRKQVRSGAHIVDICLANPDRDEKLDMAVFLDAARKTVRAPWMIDTTDKDVLEEALKRAQGKCVVNSINLEDGEERFEQICPLLHKYGGAVVVGCIDEDPTQGMGVTADRKIEIAKRSFNLLVNKYKILPHNIIFDPLVFPCGTGDRQYIGSAGQTIEGVRRITQAFPMCQTILGVSNVSFGLPAQGRQVLNTVFLHHNFEAGLSMAIVNSEKLKRITQIPKEEIILCDALMNASDSAFDQALAEFAKYFRGKQSEVVIDNRAELSLGERLAKAVVEGIKTHLPEDLAEALKSHTPLDIINGPLMDGMKRVGELFGANQMIVAEVLQSAEVMKAAVTFLEPHMEKSDDAQKGSMVLATVKGDVHDIGKNLVDIILSNNGFRIINLGIKVLPQTLIEAIRTHKPSMIGLSGLLVKSAQEMVITAEALKQANIDLPLLVGGAALSEKFTLTKIAANYQGLVCYARDAMSGLSIANQVVDATQRPELERAVEQKRLSFTTQPILESTEANTQNAEPALVIDHSKPAPTPPDLQLHIMDDLSLDVIWPYINPSMLYSRHLGLKGKLDDLIAQGDEKAKKLKIEVTQIEDEVLSKKLLTAKALYRFYRVDSHENDLFIYNEKGNPCAQFTFPRQMGKEGRCISDLAPPKSSGAKDYMAMMVTTCQGSHTPLRELAESYKNQGAYLHSHILQALAIETAEALAEWLHQRLRGMWGFPDAPTVPMRDLFAARYRGKRYSFGYPACPNLDDQAILWRLLEPQKHLGVELTEGFMMDPESSVSAIVFHHPQAAYFSTL